MSSVFVASIQIRRRRRRRRRTSIATSHHANRTDGGSKEAPVDDAAAAAAKTKDPNILESRHDLLEDPAFNVDILHVYMPSR